LIQDFRQGIFKPVISTLLQDQITKASRVVQKAMADLVQCKPKIIVVSEKAETLADVYLDRKILKPEFRADILHVALATLDEVDILVSWNYRNILHLSKLRQFITVNLELGLKPIQIRSPRIIASFDLQDSDYVTELASSGSRSA
jgi:hypothetical protein